MAQGSDNPLDILSIIQSGLGQLRGLAGMAFSGGLPPLSPPGTTPAENLITPMGAIRYGFEQGAQNPAALPTSIMDINSRVGGAVMNTLPYMNPLLGIMNSAQALDTAFSGRNEAAAAAPGLPPLSFGQMRSDLGYQDESDESATPNALSIPFDTESVPKPPVLEAPPTIDESRIARARRSNILGQMALGAAQVDPTSPGSFARALAGAGGAGAAASAESEMRMAEIAHKNALAAYETSIKNKELQYEHEGKMFQMMTPNIKATDDSVIIQEYNPKSKAYEVRVIKTGGVLEDADKLNKYVEAMSGSGPVAESTEVEYISKLYKDDPAALQTVLLRTAIERTIENGAGQAVFGDKYSNASSNVNVNPGLMTKPAEYRREHAKQVAAALLADEELISNPEWLDEAAKYGTVAAYILSKGGYGKQTD